MSREHEDRGYKKPIPKHLGKNGGSKKTKHNSVKLPKPRLDPKTLPHIGTFFPDMSEDDERYGFFSRFWRMTSTEKGLRKKQCIEKGEHSWAYSNSSFQIVSTREDGKRRQVTYYSVICGVCGEHGQSIKNTSEEEFIDE